MKLPALRGFSFARRVYRRLSRETFKILYPKHELLKKYAKSKDALNIYPLGIELFAKNPNNKFISYITAWAALKIGKFEEVPGLIHFAIKSESTNIGYLAVRGNAYLESGKFSDALRDFTEITRLRPDFPSGWIGMLKMPADLIPPLPRNITVVTFEVRKAYSTRKWEECNHLLAELKQLDPHVAKYWQLMVDDFLMRMKDPIQEWAAFLEECKAIKHPLTFDTFCNMFNHFVKFGDLKSVIANLPAFRTVYQKLCPMWMIPGVCALFIREKHFGQCLEFLNEIDTGTPKDNAWITFKLKTLIYSLICREGLKSDVKTKELSMANPLSENLLNEMIKLHYKGSAPANILDDLAHCWKLIKSSSNKLLLDLRYNNEQTIKLQTIILDAIKNKKPFSLLRLGDGDSYGFSETLPEIYSKEISLNTENMWWGKTIDPSTKHKLIDGFLDSLKSADMIGFPGSIRLARDLVVKRNANLSPLETKHKTLFTGVKNLLKENQLTQDCWWIDEFCNFSLADDAYLSELIQNATSVVLVTCFKIPEGHFFNQPKVVEVLIPPHTKVASVCSNEFGDRILPEIIEDIKAKTLAHLKPGSLLLVSAGFAGKCLIDLGKKSGAVAIDFGSAMDAALGHKTRSSELHVQSSKSN